MTVAAGLEQRFRVTVRLRLHHLFCVHVVCFFSPSKSYVWISENMNILDETKWSAK